MFNFIFLEIKKHGKAVIVLLCSFYYLFYFSDMFTDFSGGYKFRE